MKYLLTPLLLLTLISTKAQNKVINNEYEKMLDKLIPKNTPNTYISTIDTNNTLFLDARSKAEYNVSHIKGSIWVGYDEFKFNKVPSNLKNRKIIVYCSVGYRSAIITNKLNKKGYSTTNLYGGIFEWVNQGKTIVDSKGKTTKVHAYNRDWSKWLTNGIKVY